MEKEKHEADEINEQEIPRRPSRFLTAIQLFIIPLGIAGVGVGIVLLIKLLSHDPTTASEMLDSLKNASGHTRGVYMQDLVNKVLANKDALSKDEIFISKAVNVCKSITGNTEDDVKIKRYLIDILGFLRANSASAYLLQIINSNEQNFIKVRSIKALEDIGNPASISDVSHLLNHDSDEIRRYIISCVGTLAGSLNEKDDVRILTLERLKNKLEDKSELVRLNAAVILAWRLKDNSGVTLLRKMLDRKYLYDVTKGDDETTAALIHAIFGLIEINDVESIYPLTLISKNDPVQNVRELANKALSQIKKQ